jgi:hypothetical protein
MGRLHVQSVNGRTDNPTTAIWVAKEAENMMNGIVLAVVILEHKLRETAKMASVKVATAGSLPMPVIPAAFH